MDKQPIHGSSRFKRWITGSGFYMALAVCLLAIGGIAVATFAPGLLSQKPEDTESVPQQQVQKPVTDQIDDRTTTQRPTVTTTTAAPTSTAAPSQAADLYMLPLGNAVQQPFSDSAPLYSVTMGDWRTHNGTDFEGETGQTVQALADGTVKAIGEDPFWGETLVIDHGVGVISYYYGVHATVEAGSTVKVGQAIGTLTTIPCESAQKPHLHLEMTVDGRNVDPVAALGREVRSAQP